MNFLEAIKPKGTRRILLFLAAIVWTFAGGMLLFRGISLLDSVKSRLFLKVALSIAAGLIFYLLLFHKISLKHTTRILNLKIDYPCLFSFFNVKSYILMAVMISTGVLLRKTGVISHEHLSLLYITMGIPLALSSIRFYYNGFAFKKSILNQNQES